MFEKLKENRKKEGNIKNCTIKKKTAILLKPQECKSKEITK